ncbi:PAS domain-containing protein [Sulfuricystis multivorans]|uniref:PAS domain-containing protein n=1 Tax=Sulfuricystis multivorans TaxID=2211108 RepID=UPI000F83D619|nr:PAS domain-containing protein [Sulfuricystis multivorans]
MSQRGLFSLNLKTLMSVVVPALLIASLSVYALSLRPKIIEEARVLPGKPLAAYEQFYPIRADETGAIYLDRHLFEKAIDYFTANPSPREIADLIYLGNSNHVTLMLSESARSKYISLSNLPDYAAVAEADVQKDRLLQTYKDIVNGIGQTFAGTPIEIVLHDTRNPLNSIVAIQNPISGRRLGDPNTNFGIQLIKNYSQIERGTGQSFVSYGLTLKDGRQVKSTTIPLFNNTYGLIGFICLNIDISKMDGKDPAAIARFIEAFKAINENETIVEMIQKSKKRS